MDRLRRLVQNAQSLLRDGYYSVSQPAPRAPSFLEVLGTPEQPSDVIAEIKFASPTMSVSAPAADFRHLLKTFADVNPLGLSVLA